MFHDDLMLRHRVDQPEILDEGNAAKEEVQRSLEDLRRLNTFLFGVSSLLHPLQHQLRHLKKPATVLDLGSGSGQVAQALARWAREEYQAIRVIAIDLVPAHLVCARSWNQQMHTPHVLLVGGDALCLPLADKSVDYITSSLFLHHFDEERLISLFQECRRVAKHGLVMSDLWRHPLPFLAYKWLFEPLLVRSPVTRADSTTSFQRSYKVCEIQSIAARALPDVHVAIHVPSFRIILRSSW